MKHTFPPGQEIDVCVMQDRPTGFATWSQWTPQPASRSIAVEINDGDLTVWETDSGAGRTMLHTYARGTWRSFGPR